MLLFDGWNLLLSCFAFVAILSWIIVFSLPLVSTACSLVCCMWFTIVKFKNLHIFFWKIFNFFWCLYKLHVFFKTWCIWCMLMMFYLFCQECALICSVVFDYYYICVDLHSMFIDQKYKYWIQVILLFRRSK